MTSNKEIFISYCHKDIAWLDKLKLHLMVLENRHGFSIWEDSKIRVGSIWRDSIAKALDNCHVAILLVSNNFLASDFITKKEVPQLLESADRKGVLILTLILDTCSVHLTELEKFQSVNSADSPIEEMRTSARKKLFVKLTTIIQKHIETRVEQKKERQTKEHPLKISRNERLETALALSYIIRHRNPTITSIERGTGINRKHLIEILAYLLDQNLIIREDIAMLEKAKPSVTWRASKNGQEMFSLFQKTLLSISQ